MKNPENRTPKKDRWLPGVVFLVLGLFTFVLYSRIYDYVLVLERNTSYSFFLFDRQFLLDFLSGPGGLLSYAACFLAQFYESIRLAALVVAALVVGFGLLFHRVLSRLMAPAALFCALLPCIFLATALADGVIDITAGLIASTGTFLIYLAVPKGAARRLCALLAIPALYLLCGGCFWLFALWVTTTEWLESRHSRNLVWPLLLTALALATPVLAWRWVFQAPLLVSLRRAFLVPTVFAQPPYPLPAILLYGWLALLPCWAKALARVRPASAPGLNRRFVAAAAALALLAVGLPCVCYDSTDREFTEYHQLYEQKRWDDILHKAEAAPSPELMTQFFTNCALFHKGRLLDEMFRYPQPWGARGLILNFAGAFADTPLSDSDRLMFNSDLFFEMGHINAAFMHAFDNLVVGGRTYDNVKRMAECSMVNGEYALAMKYLTMLERTLYHRAYAREYKALLADAKARELHFAEQRARLPTVELPLSGASFIPPLILLKSNPHNRMAFDYLMAWCLLEPQALPMLAENVGGLQEAGYHYIPAHLQEGLLALEGMSGVSAAPAGFSCDPGMAARYNAFAEQMQSNQGNPAAQRGAGAAFSGTFMYYAMFVAPRSALSYSAQHLTVANEFRSLGWTAEAITHYRHALWLDPELAAAHAALAEMLKSQDLLEEAAFHEREARRLKTGAPKPATRVQPGTPAWIQ